MRLAGAAAWGRSHNLSFIEQVLVGHYDEAEGFKFILLILYVRKHNPKFNLILVCDFILE